MMLIYFLYYSYEKGITPDIGGFRKLWELADRLKHRGHRVKIFFPKLSGSSALRPVACTFYPLLNIPGLRALSAYLSMFFCALFQGIKERPKVIYFRTSANILPIFLGFLLRAKVVLEVNASFRDFHKTVKVSSLRNFIFSFAERFNVAFSSKIIVLTRGLKDTLIKHYKVSADKIEVIPSATDIEHFVPKDAAESKKKIGLSPERPVVGFVGIFYPHQGLNTLIKAAPLILKRYPDLLFLIVGSGMMNEEWRRLAETEGVQGSFIFTGQIPYSRMPDYFNAMDIVSAPFSSQRGHTSPLKVFDALACGRPVVASSIPSMEVLVDDFRGAIIGVNPDDPQDLARAVGEIISDKQRINSLSKTARDIIVSKYSWEVAAKKTEEAFGC